MNLYVTVKSMAKRKPHMEKRAYRLERNPQTLRELLTELVLSSVKELNSREPETPLLLYLTEEEILDRGANGKVGFGAKYNERQARPQEAVQTALTAFEDGLFLVFIRDESIDHLDSELHLQDGDEAAFIKFTMLAGRMW